MSYADPTRIDIETNPLTRRMQGVAAHGYTPFDVPFISEVFPNLYQGGCEIGMVLPRNIKHLVSLYPWERYTAEHEMLSETYVQMYDSEGQGYEQVDALASWINLCRKTGPVLVHCQAGLNRSSLVAARAIFLSEENEVPDNEHYVGNGDEIVAYLREKRSPAALCNPAFAKQVRSWGS
jgi:protein-tyrosine phosphatase